MPKHYYTFFLFLILTSAFSQDDYGDDNTLRYEDYIYKPNIRTVQLYETSWEFAQPLIKFNSGEQLRLSFDDLEGDQKQYSMTIVHCDAKWNASDLMIQEYIQGFYDMNLLNFSFSVNTLQKYTHYSIVFPTQNMQLTKSGNYIVYVYQNGDKNKLILSRRFMVLDEKVSVIGNIKQSVGNDEQYEKQHLDFSVVNTSYNITNSHVDLKVVISQNYRWDNAVYDIKPTFNTPTQLTYSLDDMSTFNGGNEFRFFDLRSLRTYTERIKNIYKDSTNHYRAELMNDDNRSYLGYIFYNDINGGFLIKNRDMALNQDIEADYVNVNFFMPFDNPTPEGNFYVLGKLTNWKLDKVNRMSYNYKRSGYECNLLIKQGYYNYIYAFLKDKSKAGDETLTEGNHWETENDYIVYVYHRTRGTYYDQLIGVRKFNSRKP
jgi:hypothetical protein